MAFTKEGFSLFWSMPPDAQDWGNLARSHCKRVMLVYTHASPGTISRLAQMGVRVVIRLNNDDVTYLPVDQIRRQIDHIMQVGGVDAVICGNELDEGLDMTYGSQTTWGQERAWTWLTKFAPVRNALRGLVPVVSPALMAPNIWEEGAPQPGRTVWQEITRDAYNDCEYNGLHYYSAYWDGDVDLRRLKLALIHAQGGMHRPLYIDEIGILHGTEQSRMYAYIEISKLLETHPLGQRISMLCPFVSNGNGQGWDPRYLIKDPEAYRLLGDYLSG